jgi:hypothetical protein
MTKIYDDDPQQYENDAKAEVYNYEIGKECCACGNTLHTELTECPDCGCELEPMTTENEALKAENAILRARIKELEQAQAWIPVDERLPDDTSATSPVLVFGRYVNKNIYPWAYWTAYLIDGEWHNDVDHFCIEEVTHWMPLPQPPEAQS